MMIPHVNAYRHAIVMGAALLTGVLAVAGGANAPTVHHPDELKPIAVSPGVWLEELTGRSTTAGAKTRQSSVAYFRLEPGRASAWSYTKVGEESFFVLKGHGTVWVGDTSHPVRPGSFILIPPGAVRSIRASGDESLEFYAVTTPAWHSDDDVMTTAPTGAPE